jgi:hypothetical protein
MNVFFQHLRVRIIPCTGHFMLQKHRLLDIVVPDFTNCKLKPYVTPTCERNVKAAVVKL